MLSKRVLRQILRPRPKRVHKKQLGQLLLIVGSRNMPGAGLLTTKAAFRAGAGVVTVAYPECLRKEYIKIVGEAFHLSLPQTSAGTLALRGYSEIINSASVVDIVALGPGLGSHYQTQALIKKLIKKISKPLVIDASGLNALGEISGASSVLKNRQNLTILTPHQGEMSSLTGMTTKAISQHRKKVASKFARLWQSFVVLKGYQTVIATPEGKMEINKTGGPALATAGSGDVLTGIITTLVAQNINKPFTSTSVAVYLHGLAGDLAAKYLGERSVIASDIIEYLPSAIKHR